MELTPLRCTQCGAPINGNHCDHCGTDFLIEIGSRAESGIIPMSWKEFQDYKKSYMAKELEEQLAKDAGGNEPEKKITVEPAFGLKLQYWRTLQSQWFGRKPFPIWACINGKHYIDLVLTPGIPKKHEQYVAKAIDKTVLEIIEGRKFASMRKKSNRMKLERNLISEFIKEFITCKQTTATLAENGE